MADAASDSSPASMPENNSRSAIASSSSISAMALPSPLLRLNTALQQQTHRRPLGVYRFIAKQRLILAARLGWVEPPGPAGACHRAARGRTRWAGPMVNSATPAVGLAAGSSDGFLNPSYGLQSASRDALTQTARRRSAAACT